MSNKELTKKEIKAIRQRLTREPRLVWDELGASEKKKAFALCDEYKEFLDQAKTEREAVSVIRDAAKKMGFSKNPKPGSGKPFYMVFQEKTIALVRPGKGAIDNGVRLIVSHIDAPRLDLKQNPLYEDVDLTFLKTHYYGGIKKFQWVTRPLAIHGRVIKADGEAVDIVVGEDEKDPVFCVLDLLPHLARKSQYDKKLGEAIPGEKLNVIAGSIPIGDKETKDRFKLALLRILNGKYGFVEEDFISAELEVVPAGKAKDVGWDRSLIGAYGHDDRSSAFTSLKALFDGKDADCTSVIIFIDKEEIGSEGATGAKSKLIESVIARAMIVMGHGAGSHKVLDILSKSKALSADVNGALDPDYQEVHEKLNAARLGYGVCVTKFTGHGGKSGANDANAEYVGWVRRLFNSKKVTWQTGELGKVDEGGGGTVAKFLAVYGMDVIDYGVPVLSMHAPFEIAHKGDLYMTYKGCRVFLKADD